MLGTRNMFASKIGSRQFNDSLGVSKVKGGLAWQSSLHLCRSLQCGRHRSQIHLEVDSINRILTYENMVVFNVPVYMYIYIYIYTIIIL